MSRRAVDLVLVGTFVSLFAVTIRGVWTAISMGDPYILGDWQINYVGGFVRRGLLGELPRYGLEWFGVDTRTTVFAVQFLVYGAFFGFSLPLVAAAIARYPVFAFAAASPLAFSFGAASPSAAGRKEIVFLATLSALAWRLNRRSKETRATLCGLSLVCAALVLTHEMLIFFLPFILLLVAVATPESISWRTVAYTMAPAAVALAFSMAFHGGSAQVAAICGFLGSSGPPTCESRGAIRYLEVGFQDSVREVYYSLLRWPHMVMIAEISFVLGALPFALVARNGAAAVPLRRTFATRSTKALALVASFAPLPLFLVGDDWGRWIYTILTSWTVLVAFVLARGREVPEAAGSRETKLAGAHGVAVWAAVLLLLVYALAWNARGVCCPERLGNGLLGRIFPSWPPWPGRCGGGADCSTSDRGEAVPRALSREFLTRAASSRPVGG